MWQQTNEQSFSFIQIGAAILAAAGLSTALEAVGPVFVRKLRATLHFLRRRRKEGLQQRLGQCRPPVGCTPPDAPQALEGQPLQHVIARCEGQWVLEDLRAAVWQGDAAAKRRVDAMLTAGYGAKQTPPDRRAWADAALAIQSYQQPGHQPAQTRSRRRRHMGVLASKDSYTLTAAVATAQILPRDKGLQRNQPDLNSNTRELSAGQQEPALLLQDAGPCVHQLPSTGTATDALSAGGDTSARADTASMQQQAAQEQEEVSVAVCHGSSQNSNGDQCSWHTGCSLGAAVAATLLQSYKNGEPAELSPGMWRDDDSVGEPSPEAGDSEEEEQLRHQHGIWAQVVAYDHLSGSWRKLEGAFECLV